MTATIVHTCLISSQKTAIVIDDDPDVLDALSELFEIKQIRVIGKGESGKEAVELYQTLSPELIFLDVNMPDYDGSYALENIRKINPNAHVIMITGNTPGQILERVKKMKPTAIFSKPVCVNKIIEFVNSLPVGDRALRLEPVLESNLQYHDAVLQ